MAVWKQPQTHRDHVWNFWASQRQSLCHTKSGPAHAKLRSFGIFLNPCLPFVFLAYLWLHQVRESSQVPPCSWCSSAERFGCWGPACTHQPSNSRLNTNRKTTRTTKKAFKLVCTKTFPKNASFMKGLKSMEQHSCCNYSLIVQDRSIAMGREAEGQIHIWCKQKDCSEYSKNHNLSLHVRMWPTMLKDHCCWSLRWDHGETQASTLINKNKENLKCTIHSLHHLFTLLKNSCSLNRVFLIHSNGFWSSCISLIFPM